MSPTTIIICVFVTVFVRLDDFRGCLDTAWTVLGQRLDSIFCVAQQPVGDHFWCLCRTTVQAMACTCKRMRLSPTKLVNYDEKCIKSTIFEFKEKTLPCLTQTGESFSLNLAGNFSCHVFVGEHEDEMR